MNGWSDTHSLFYDDDGQMVECDALIDRHNTAGEIAMDFEYILGFIAFIAPKHAHKAINHRRDAVTNMGDQ